jgi:hypothetical protein
MFSVQLFSVQWFRMFPLSPAVTCFTNESTDQTVVSTAAEKPLSGFNSFRFRDSTFHLLVGLLESEPRLAQVECSFAAGSADSTGLAPFSKVGHKMPLKEKL